MSVNQVSDIPRIDKIPGMSVHFRIWVVLVAVSSITGLILLGLGATLKQGEFLKFGALGVGLAIVFTLVGIVGLIIRRRITKDPNE